MGNRAASLHDMHGRGGAHSLPHQSGVHGLPADPAAAVPRPPWSLGKAQAALSLCGQQPRFVCGARCRGRNAKGQGSCQRQAGAGTRVPRLQGVSSLLVSSGWVATAG